MKYLIGYLIAAGAVVAVILYLIAAYGAATVTLALNGGPEEAASLVMLRTDDRNGEGNGGVESAQFGAFEVAVPQPGKRSARGAGTGARHPCDEPPGHAQQAS